MDNVLNILQGILEAIGDFFKGLLGGITDIFSATDSTELIYTAIARWAVSYTHLCLHGAGRPLTSESS